ncbi:hypothetical protein L916_08157 [Phytophthora nicotianae]|uniref:Uncharacterized protein n=1 Tax=Phytophthora nicotianae TaxID=4792 RepID=W2J2W2_PHYNI|nr:hypothetical protein L916_08157 [Phytophthora nicotianae]
MVNRIMDTSTFESGSFWQFVDPPVAIFRLAAFGLTCVGVGYSLVLIKLVRERQYYTRVSPDKRAVTKTHVLSTDVVGAIKSAFTKAAPKRSLSSAASLVISLTSDESIARKRLVLKLEHSFLLLQGF